MENTGQEEDLPETIGSIAPFVLGCLEQRSFFSELEKRVWPEGPDGRRDCDHSLDHTLCGPTTGKRKIALKSFS